MENKKPYRIDESALREKFANYHVSFNASCLEILESEVAQVKTHASLELPDAKKIIRFVGIPLALIILGCAIFFTYDYVKNLPTSTPVEDTIVIKPVFEPKIETQPKQEVKPAVVAVDTIKTETPKKDTVMPTVDIPQKTKNIVKSNQPQKINALKKDTTSAITINPTQVDSVKKKNRVDTTSSSNRNKNTPTKKKKKRRNSLDATEDIRQSEPNSADDDVIVPNN